MGSSPEEHSFFQYLCVPELVKIALHLVLQAELSLVGMCWMLEGGEA